jgi:hypothetical protein
MSMQGHLEEREDREAMLLRLEKRDAAGRIWMSQGQPIEARLLKFDTWIRAELATRIDWAWAGTAKAKRIEQCRAQLERLVLALWRRGWMLDGAKLAKHLRTALDDVGAAQRAGRVKDFWPFFKSVVDKYVGLNSEEIQAEAMSNGSAVSQVFELLKKSAPSLPEAMAQRKDETIRAKQQQLRKQAASAAVNQNELRFPFSDLSSNE